jgi:hypothetical protein
MPKLTLNKAAEDFSVYLKYPTVLQARSESTVVSFTITPLLASRILPEKVK